ncbi:hypothetical protein [Bowmanella denitrificans]|uniref:hypothetical protein n=1 Tax=Bowmanella denitrificans TaxID=366582 RepID=UPI000C9A019A|nr:hypothetical protein [Bowmanella denitrificans]
MTKHPLWLEKLGTQTHPDYDHDAPMHMCAQQSWVFAECATNVIEEVEFVESPVAVGKEARLWLGTAMVNGQPTQLQLVATQVPADFIDEG